eukprot:TRINITY_DN5425_c0_g1_i1.p1 TRINITY_DN5425_c0_g1~~TRINITY_DN5425_c0_g1_i1.p1  ORF type:complete len:1157 (+),score=224.13 TRINITY_DN5425_c0_g1_i1:133-3603(+)
MVEEFLDVADRVKVHKPQSCPDRTDKCLSGAPCDETEQRRRRSELRNVLSVRAARFNGALLIPNEDKKVMQMALSAWLSVIVSTPAATAAATLSVAGTASTSGWKSASAARHRVRDQRLRRFVATTLSRQGSVLLRLFFVGWSSLMGESEITRMKRVVRDKVLGPDGSARLDDSMCNSGIDFICSPRCELRSSPLGNSRRRDQSSSTPGNSPRSGFSTSPSGSPRGNGDRRMAAIRSTAKHWASLAKEHRATGGDAKSGLHLGWCLSKVAAIRPQREPTARTTQLEDGDEGAAVLAKPKAPASCNYDSDGGSTVDFEACSSTAVSTSDGGGPRCRNALPWDATTVIGASDVVNTTISSAIFTSVGASVPGPSLSERHERRQRMARSVPLRPVTENTCKAEKVQLLKLTASAMVREDSALLRLVLAGWSRLTDKVRCVSGVLHLCSLMAIATRKRGLVKLLLAVWRDGFVHGLETVRMGEGIVCVDDPLGHPFLAQSTRRMCTLEQSFVALVPHDDRGILQLAFDAWRFRQPALLVVAARELLRARLQLEQLREKASDLETDVSKLQSMMQRRDCDVLPFPRMRSAGDLAKGSIAQPFDKLPSQTDEERMLMNTDVVKFQGVVVKPVQADHDQAIASTEAPLLKWCTVAFATKSSDVLMAFFALWTAALHKRRLRGGMLQKSMAILGSSNDRVAAKIAFHAWKSGGSGGKELVKVRLHLEQVSERAYELEHEVHALLQTAKEREAVHQEVLCAFADAQHMLEETDRSQVDSVMWQLEQEQRRNAALLLRIDDMFAAQASGSSVGNKSPKRSYNRAVLERATADASVQADFSFATARVQSDFALSMNEVNIQADTLPSTEAEVQVDFAMATAEAEVPVDFAPATAGAEFQAVTALPTAEADVQACISLVSTEAEVQVGIALATMEAEAQTDVARAIAEAEVQVDFAMATAEAEVQVDFAPATAAVEVQVVIALPTADAEIQACTTLVSTEAEVQVGVAPATIEAEAQTDVARAIAEAEVQVDFVAIAEAEVQAETLWPTAAAEIHFGVATATAETQADVQEAAALATVEAEATSLFARLDKEGDGTVPLHEFLDVLHEVGACAEDIGFPCEAVEPGTLVNYKELIQWAFGGDDGETAVDAEVPRQRIPSSLLVETLRV